MKSLRHLMVILSLLATLLASCSLGAQADTNAVNTAVAGTQQAEALVQATVNSAVLTALPATPTPGPTVEYITLTEEELAALIDEAVNEAVTATTQTTSAVTDTTSDGTVTTEEVVYVYDYYYSADYYVEYAEELIYEYYALYADLASEMIAELNAIEAELNQMNETLSSIDSSLQEISSTLEQGLALAEETITQLETAAAQAQTNASELQTQAQDMIQVLQLDQQNRLNQIQQIQANNTPSNRPAALQAGFDFIDTAKNALADGKLSRDEMLNIAQLGRNAQAGFQQFGGAGGVGPGNGPELSQFTGKFDEIMTQFARGQMPQARANLDGFEVSLGQRPGAGGGPGGGGGPNLPGGGPGPFNP